jgi:diacylglycerol kinase (ATP)
MRKWIESADNAIEGIIHAAQSQRHVRYHFYTAFAVLILSYVLGIARTDFLIISVAVILVLLAEMLNTALEYLVDMVCPEFNEKARAVKDISAGAVLITAFGAAVLGYAILFPYIRNLFETGPYIAKHSREEIALISIILVLIAVIVFKAYTGKGHPLRGGMPSGHSATAFSAWVSVTYLAHDFRVSIVCLFLALLISGSRLFSGTHTLFEVIAGAILGSGLTFLLFLLFN